MMGLKLEGIGATLSPEDGVVRSKAWYLVALPIKMDASRWVTRSFAVGQEDSTEDVDVVDMKLDDVVSLIRGPAGSKVRLTIQPKVGSETKVVEIHQSQDRT